MIPATRALSAEILQDRHLCIRFERKVLFAANNCWNFQGGKNQSGYGMVHYRGRSQLAHRIAYQIYIGKIPQGICVLHACDNRICCNPAHLWLGDNNNNTQDMVGKGRHHKRLTREQIDLALEELKKGRTQASIAEELKVTRSAITKLAARRL